jgi:hypothetical protein
MAAAGEVAHVTPVNPQQGPKAIMLDLVNPAIALWRLG